MRGLVLAACLIAGGCGGASVQPSGRDDPQNLLQGVERGATTKDQVRVLFGGDAKIEPLADGYEQWTYQTITPLNKGRYLPGSGFSPEVDRHTFVVFVFDKTGVVRDYTSSTSLQ
jgi:hypothetical protein